VIAVLLAGLILSRTAAAAEDDPCAGAIAHFERGLRLGGQRGYEEALKEFRQAYGMCPDFSVLYNIGQALVALQQPIDAIEALAHYLREGAERIAPGRRHKVSEQIARLAAGLGGVTPPVPTISVRCEDPGWVLLLDGQRIDATAAVAGVPVEVGSHRVVLLARGRRFPAQMIEVSEGLHVHLICEIAGAPAAPNDPRGVIDGPPIFPADRPGREIRDIR
jgi:hypothetical protein